jgi:Flp pilus assembly protein TadB
MYSPQYLRNRQSLATDEESLKALAQSRSRAEDEGSEQGNLKQQEKNEEELRLAGLRKRSLMLLFAWLGMVAFMALLLLVVSK